MEEQVTPDWVMVGWRDGDQYYLIASEELTQADLDAQTDIIRGFMSDQPIRTIICMDKFHLIVGESYGDCLRHLFHIWTPNEDGKPAIAPASHRSED